MLSKLFRRKSRQVSRLATDLDTQRPHLSGVFVRFDEGHSEAVAFFSQLNPSFSPPSLPEGAPESVRAGFAAHDLAIGIAFEAMRSQGKLLLDGRDMSIFESAIGLSYAIFIFMLLSGYLKADGVEIDSKPLASGFAELFVYLNDAQRTELVKKGLELFQDMIGSAHEKVKDWHDTLSKAVQLWLISATSDKRTKEHDEDLRKVFASHLGALYRAME